ncbi:unnamed protein product, partial [marine sediment metagenome]
AVKEGVFREDLYHRLNQFTIRLPGLSDRKGDIPALAADFLSQANRTLKKNVRSVSEEAMNVLKNYSWPGNVRELKNSIIRAALLADSRILPEHLQLPGDVPSSLHNFTPAAPQSATQAAVSPENLDLKFAVKSVAAEAEKRLIVKALEITGNNKVKAARLLKIDRKALYNKLHQHKLGT